LPSAKVITASTWYLPGLSAGKSMMVWKYQSTVEVRIPSCNAAPPSAGRTL